MSPSPAFRLQGSNRPFARTGALPFVVGGDHTLQYPDVAGLADVHGKGSFGVVHFDSHFDAGRDYPHFITHGQPVYRAVKEGHVLARNYSGPGSLVAVCSLDTPGLVQLDPADKALALPFNVTKFAPWSVVASKLGENPVTARLITAAGSDGIELPLVVLPFTAPDRFVLSGGVQDTVTEAFEVPFNAVPEGSSVEVRLSPGMALGIIEYNAGAGKVGRGLRAAGSGRRRGGRGEARRDLLPAVRHPLLAA